MIDGPLVVFTRADGSLASIRLNKVDLEASRPSGAESYRSPDEKPVESPAPATRDRESVMVLTNRDVPRAASSRGPAIGYPEGTSAARSTSPVRVETWLEAEVAGGFEIVGQVRNRGSVVERIQGISVDLRDRDGGLIRSVLALPKRNLLETGATTTFRARFRQVADRRIRPSFKVESVKADSGPAERPQSR